MKICIVVPGHFDVSRGGAEYQADLLANYLLSKTPHQVVYVTRDRPPTQAYPVHSITKVAPSFKFGLFWDAFSLMRALRKENPDVVIQRVGGAYTGICAWYCNRQKIPFIYCISSDADITGRKWRSFKSWPRKLDQFLLHYGVRQAHYVVAQTSQQAFSLYVGLGQGSHVIPSFHPEPVEGFSKTSVFRVLWVGNFKPLKQPEKFIEMARKLKSSGILFQMIGAIPNDEWGLAIQKAVFETSNLRWFGALPQEEVNQHLRGANLLVNTSQFEGLPNTFVQAWMRKVPVISLNADPDGVIQEFKIGRVSGSFGTLCSDVLELQRDYLKWEAMAARARAFAIERYSMDNARKLVTVLETADSVRERLAYG